MPRVRGCRIPGEVESQSRSWGKFSPPLWLPRPLCERSSWDRGKGGDSEKTQRQEELGLKVLVHHLKYFFFNFVKFPIYPEIVFSQGTLYSTH